eukprot:INCI17594.3.p1 GENE.INCI17594.3~~INCI17594.3.p1  ORF type:complete len:4143 (+),score=722.43 INCI17594.3:103-12429(+)
MDAGVAKRATLWHFVAQVTLREASNRQQQSIEHPMCIPAQSAQTMKVAQLRDLVQRFLAISGKLPAGVDLSDSNVFSLQAVWESSENEAAAACVVVEGDRTVADVLQNRLDGAVAKSDSVQTLPSRLGFEEAEQETSDFGTDIPEQAPSTPRRSSKENAEAESTPAAEISKPIVGQVSDTDSGRGPVPSSSTAGLQASASTRKRLLRHKDETAWNFQMRNYTFRSTRHQDFVEDTHQVCWRHCTSIVLRNLGKCRSEAAHALQWRVGDSHSVVPNDVAKVIWGLYDKDEHLQQITQLCRSVEHASAVCRRIVAEHTEPEQARRIRRIVALQSLIRGAIVRKTVAEFGALRFLDFVEFPDEHAASHSRQTTDVDTLYKPLRRTASSLLRSESTATAKLLQQHPYYALSVLGAARASNSLIRLTLRRATRTEMPKFSCVGNVAVKFMYWSMPQVLVVEAGSVLPDTIEYNAGLRGNDVICAVSTRPLNPGSMDLRSGPSNAGADLCTRLKMWANSSRLELNVVVARFSELPSHVQSGLRMTTGDRWKDLRTSLGQACARSLFTRWGEIREAVTMKRVNAAKTLQRFWRARSAKKKFVEAVVQRSEQEINGWSPQIQQTSSAAATVFAAQKADAVLFLEMEAGRGLGMRISFNNPSRLLSRVHQSIEVLEITDAEGAAADAGLQTGDIIFGLDGVNYSADSVGFDPIAIESPSDEEESQVSDITSEATANDANDADGPDSDDEDTSVYQVGIDKCFPGMRLGANVNYGYGMNEFWVIIDVIDVDEFEEEVLVCVIDESYAAAMEEAEQMAEVTPRVPGDPAPKFFRKIPVKHLRILPNCYSAGDVVEVLTLDAEVPKWRCALVESEATILQDTDEWLRVRFIPCANEEKKEEEEGKEDYDDEQEAQAVNVCRCRPVQPVHEGASVEAQTKSGDLWMPGTVTSNEDENYTIEFINGEVIEAVPRQQLRVLPLDQYDVSQAMSSALEIESALRAKWTARREEKRANDDHSMAATHVQAGMHVAVNANYGPGMKEFWVMAEIVQVQPDENQIVVQIMDSAYEIAMAEAEDAAGITPRDESAPTPRFFRAIPMEFVRPGPVLFSNGDIVEYLSEDNEWVLGSFRGIENDTISLSTTHDSTPRIVQVAALRVRIAKTPVIGEAVEALYGEGSAWFPATVDDVNDDGTFYLVYEDGDVEERVERVNIRHASPDPNVLTDAIESALEMESALRAKWTVHREEKREQDATLHPAHLTPGMHVAANANYGRGMEEFWIIAEIVCVLPEHDAVVVLVRDTAYNFAMQEAESAAEVTPRDESGTSPRFYRKIPIRFLRVAPVVFSSGDAVEVMLQDDELRLWHLARFERVDDGHVTVELSAQEADEQVTVPVLHVRPAAELHDGDAVECLVEGGEEPHCLEWLPGCISHVADDKTYSVTLSEEDRVELNVPRHAIRCLRIAPEDEAQIITDAEQMEAALTERWHEAFEVQEEARLLNRRSKQEQNLLERFRSAVTDSSAPMELLVARPTLLNELEVAKCHVAVPDMLKYSIRRIAQNLVDTVSNIESELHERQLARRALAVTHIQRRFRAQRKSQLYFRSVTTTQWATMRQRLQCRRIGHLHRGPMKNTLRTFANEHARKQLDNIKVGDWQMVRWCWVRRRKEFPTFETRRVLVGSDAPCPCVEISITPAVDAELCSILKDDVETDCRIPSSVIKVPVLAKVVPIHQLVGCVDTSKLSAWQKFRVSTKLQTTYGHPLITEQVADEQWISEWSRQWDDLVEASTYDSTGFDDDDEVDMAANLPNPSVKDAVAAAVAARTEAASKQRRADRSLNSRVSMGCLSAMFTTQIPTEFSFKNALGQPTKTFPLKELVHRLIEHIASFEPPSALRGDSVLRASLLQFADFLHRRVSPRHNQLNDLCSNQKKFLHTMMEAAAFDVDGDGYVSVEDMLAVFRHTNILIAGHSLLNSIAFVDFEQSSANGPLAMDRAHAAVDQVPEEPDALLVSLMATKKLALEVQSLGRPSLSTWISATENLTCCIDCVWRSPLVGRCSNDQRGAYSNSVFATAFASVVPHVAASNGLVVLHSDEDDSWEWLARSMSAPLRRVRHSTKIATLRRVDAILNRQTEMLGQGSIPVPKHIAAYGATGHGLISSLGAIASGAYQKRVELLALCRRFEQHGLTNSGAAAARFVAQTEALQPADVSATDAGFGTAVAKILSERKQQDQDVAVSMELAFETRKKMGLQACQLAQQSAAESQQELQELWKQFDSRQRRAERTIRLSQHHWNVARLLLVTADGNTCADIHPQFATAKLPRGAWGYSPWFASISAPHGPDAAPSFSSTNERLKAAQYGTVFHRLGFEWLARAAATLMKADARRKAKLQAHAGKAGSMVAAVKNQILLDKQLGALRTTVSRMVTNRRLWADRFNPFHPGLLLLKNVIVQAEQGALRMPAHGTTKTIDIESVEPTKSRSLSDILGMRSPKAHAEAMQSNPLKLLVKVPSVAQFSATMTRSRDDGFEPDLPNGLFSTHDVMKAVHDIDSSAAITTALCRGLAIERAFQATVVNALVTECKANADGAAYVVPFTMDTASEIGVQTRRHFRSPVPGMPLESAGFEMRQALYPNLAGLRTNHRQGVVTVNSVDFVVFSESDLSVVVHTLIAGSVLTNPKQRQGGVVDKSQLKQKTLPRQRSTWQHRLFDLTPLAFEEIVANVPTEVNTTEHACVGVSMFMDLELTQRWSELTKNPQVADDLNDCYAQLTAQTSKEETRSQCFNPRQFTRTTQNMQDDDRFARVVVQVRVWLDPAVRTAAIQSFWAIFRASLRPIDLYRGMRDWLGVGKQFSQALEYRRRQFTHALKDAEQSQASTKDYVHGTQPSFPLGSSANSKIAVQTYGGPRQVAPSVRHRVFCKARKAGRSIACSESDSSAELDEASTSGDDDNNAAAGAERVSRPQHQSQSLTETQTSTSAAKQVDASVEAARTKAKVAAEKYSLILQQHEKEQRESIIMARKRKALMSSALKQYQTQNAAKSERARMRIARRDLRRRAYLWKKGDDVLARIVGDAEGRGATRRYFPARILKPMWRSPAEDDDIAKRFYLVKYTSSLLVNTAPEVIDGADIKAHDDASSGDESSDESDDSSTASSVEYWSAVPIGATFVVFDDPENMDPNEANVGRFMGITSAPGTSPLRAAIQFIDDRKDELGVAVTRLFPCEVEDPELMSTVSSTGQVQSRSAELDLIRQSATAATDAASAAAELSELEDLSAQQQLDALRAQEAVFLATTLRSVERAANDMLDTDSGQKILDHRAQVAWAYDNGVVRKVLVDRHADSLGIPLGIDASVEQQVVLTVLGQSLPMLDPSLVLTGVETGSPLSRHGVAPGDVIVALNGARFRDLQHFGAQIKSSPRLLFDIVHMRGDAAPPVLDSYRSSVREALLADLGHRTMSKARVVFAVQHASEIARLTRGHSPLAGLFQEQQPRVLMSFDDGEAAISNASPREVFEQSASSDVAIDSTDRESARRLLLEALELQARPGVDSHSALADEASLQPVLGEIRKGLEARMAEFIDRHVLQAENETHEVLNSTVGQDILKYQAKLQWCWDHNAVRTIDVERASVHDPLDIEAVIAHQVDLEFGDLLLHISQAVLEVTCVEKQSILIAHGVSPGDVFLTVNDKSVDTIETFRETVRKSEALRIKVASLHEAPITEAYLAKVRNAIHARMRHETRLKAQELFHAVHKEEFAQREQRPDIFKTAFHAHDLDGDGVVDEQEAQHLKDEGRTLLRHFMNAPSHTEETLSIAARRARIFVEQAKEERARREHAKFLARNQALFDEQEATKRRTHRERAQAAIKLQLQVRARRARDAIRKKHEDILASLGDKQRMHAWAIRRSKDEAAAAVRLQMVVRMRNARKTLEMRREASAAKRAAIKLQALWRGNDARRPQFENRRQRRKRRRATRRRQERMAAKHARQNSRSRVDDADSDTSNSSSCDEGPVVGRAFLGGAPTGRPQHNHHQTLGDEVRTFRQMVERGNAMKRLERAMRLLGLQLERAHFEHCTVQEIRLVTARYNRHNKQIQRERSAFDLWGCLDSMVENAAAERLQRSMRRHCKRKADKLARVKAQAERDHQQLEALRERQVS